MNRDNELQSVLDAIALPIARIMKTLWLAGVFMYAFTVIGFIFFHDHFLDAERANYKDENNCNSVLQCLLFTLYSGLISSETWAAASLTDLWPLHRYSAAHDQEVEFVPIVVARYFYDLLFFIIIGVVLIGGVLFGIILDKFFEIRQNKAEVIEDQQKKCFICGVESEARPPPPPAPTHTHTHTLRACLPAPWPRLSYWPSFLSRRGRPRLKEGPAVLAVPARAPQSTGRQ